MNTPNGTPFTCRVCGASCFKDNYTCEVVADVTHQDTRETASVEKCNPMIGYECEGCSVLFADPDKFTKPN